MSLPTWEEAAEDEFWEKVPQDLHEGAVTAYLGSRGDAIDARTMKLTLLAETLFRNGHHGPSIVASVVALEVMIQYFCVRPIVEGAILSDLVGLEVSKRIVGSRTSDQRQMLSAVLKPWGIELAMLLLPNHQPLWDQIQTVVVKKRDGFVHRGDDVSEEEAKLGIECVRSFREQVVLGLAKRLGFTIAQTGCWSKIIHKSPVIMGGAPLGGETNYGRTDPFASRK
jgi:hypothetical protein